MDYRVLKNGIVTAVYTDPVDAIRHARIYGGVVERSDGKRLTYEIKAEAAPTPAIVRRLAPLEEQS